MIRNTTECKECIKQDVCSIQNSYKNAVSSVSEANTSSENRSILWAKDNQNISIVIGCSKYSTGSVAIR